MANKLTKDQVLNIQKSWGEGIVKIGEDFINQKDYKSEALLFINKHYNYNDGQVLFKPTMAAEEQFRDTIEKALSYFIGGDSVCAEDRGFAIRPWIKVRFENAGIIVNENNAIAMGNYFFTTLDEDGKEVKVEYTFGYILTKEGTVKINLHHSSLPYSNDT